MTTELPLTGGCGCGAVRFEIDAPLVSASYCHCTRCQRRTGTAASANAGTRPGSFRLVAGDDQVRIWAPEGGYEKAFGVRLGALDRDPGIRPQWHQFVAYAAPWEPLPDDGLPRHPESRRG